MKTQFLSLLVMFVGSVVGGFVCTAVMGANSLAKADDKPKAAEEKPGDRVIEAREIRIVDDKGKVRAFFGWDESVNRSALVLNDRDSNIRAAIRVADDGPEFVLSGV